LATSSIASRFSLARFAERLGQLSFQLLRCVRIDPLARDGAEFGFLRRVIEIHGSRP
jgi:hypothetical protein